MMPQSIRPHRSFHVAFEQCVEHISAKSNFLTLFCREALERFSAEEHLGGLREQYKEEDDILHVVLNGQSLAALLHPLRSFWPLALSHRRQR